MAYGFVVVTFGHVPIRASQSPTHCNALKFNYFDLKNEAPR
jgi:hypothetical protein